MTTQVSFTADQKLKSQALAKAKQEGITLKAFLIFAMKGYVEGKFTVGLDAVDEEPEVEELFFEDENLRKKARQLAALL